MRNSKYGMRLLVLALLVSGCASLPRHVAKTHSEALADPATTSLGRIVAAEQAGASLSGIRLLTSGEEALADLITLADHA
jgi:cardiolipin synthase C